MSVKRLLSFGLLFLLLFPHGAGAVSYSYNLFSKMIGKDPDQYELSWQKIFSKEENFGQDLYLKMYQSMVYAPDSAVKHEVAQEYGLSLADAEDVLNGSVTPLLNSPKYSKTFSQNQAFTMAANIQKSFREKLAIANLKSEFDAQSVPTEIFANGDLSDSGFDLLADLDVIEYYLFVDKTPNAVNTTLPGAKTKPSKDSPPTISTPQQITFSGAQRDRLLAASSIFDSGFDILASVSPSSVMIPGLMVNPFAQQNQCIVPNAVDTAILNYQNIPGNKPGSLTPVGGADGHIPAGNASGSSGSRIDGTGGGDEAHGADALGAAASGEAASAELHSADALFPMDASLCASGWDGNFVYEAKGPKEFSANANSQAFASFCFAILTKSRDYSTFYPTKPCINCTISAMNQALKETVSHSLVPSKLTGNIFESAKCKDGVNLSNLFDLNIFVVPMPILTPPKYGAYEGHDIAREFELFSKKYLPLSQAREDQKKDDPATQDDTEDELLEKQSTAQCLSYGSSDMTQVELLNCVNEIVASEKGRTKSAISEKNDQVALRVSSELYQPVAQELVQMRTFFQIFKEMFSEIQTKTCPNLNSKVVK